MGSVVLSKGRKMSDKVLQLLLLTRYGCHTPTDSALVGCLSWLYMKKRFCAFIFRVAILISPLKVIFFLLSHSSIYCRCTWWYLISIFGFLLNSHTQRRAVFPFCALLDFSTFFVLLGLPQISLLLSSCPWFIVSAVSNTGHFSEWQFY